LPPDGIKVAVAVVWPPFDQRNVCPVEGLVTGIETVEPSQTLTPLENELVIEGSGLIVIPFMLFLDVQVLLFVTVTSKL